MSAPLTDYHRQLAAGMAEAVPLEKPKAGNLGSSTNGAESRAAKLKPCPFCGWEPPADLSDVLYPTGTYRRVEERHGYVHYVSHNQSREGDTPCWAMHCTTNMGGCGASIDADSEAEAIAAWNRRTGSAA